MRSKILLSFVLMFAFLFTGCNTDEDMRAQYDLGYEEGYAAGEEAGLGAGYEEGLRDGMEIAKIVDEVSEEGIAYYVDTKETPLNIREEPQQDSKTIGSIPKGTDILIYDTDAGFGFTEYNGAKGWVNLEYCVKGENPNPSAVETEDAVYVTDTGSKYHKSGCGYLKSKNAISLEEAKQRGYEPCSRCF